MPPGRQPRFRPGRRPPYLSVLCCPRDPLPRPLRRPLPSSLQHQAKRREARRAPASSSRARARWGARMLRPLPARRCPPAAPPPGAGDPRDRCSGPGSRALSPGRREACTDAARQPPARPAAEPSRAPAEPAEPAEPAARLREETKGAGAGAGAGGRGLGRAGGGWAGQARAGGLAVLRPQCRAESRRAGGKRGATSSPLPRSISFPSQAAGVIGGASGVRPHPPPRWAPGGAYITFGEIHPPAMLCLQRRLGSLGRTAAWKSEMLLALDRKG